MDLERIEALWLEALSRLNAELERHDFSDAGQVAFDECKERAVTAWGRYYDAQYDAALEKWEQEQGL